MRPPREPLTEKIKRTTTIVQGFFGLFYIGIAYYVIAKQWFMVPLVPAVAYAFGGLLIIYGIYRIYRSIGILREFFEKK